MALSKIGSLRNLLTKLSSLKPTSCSYRMLVKKPPQTIQNGQRTFLNLFNFKKSERKLKILDNVSADYKLIYQTTMDQYLLSMQYVSALSILGVIAVGIFIDIRAKREWKPGDIIIHSDNEVMVYLGCILCLVVLMQYVLKKMPIRIYRSPSAKQYIFVLRSVVPMMKKTIKCKAGEISKYDERLDGLPLNQFRYIIKNSTGYMLFESGFKVPAELRVMLGQQELYQEDDEY